MPISLKERLIGLLYGDAGPRIIRGTKLVELLVFVSRISSAFEQLILKKKAEARESAPPPGKKKASPKAPAPPTPKPERMAIEAAELVSKEEAPPEIPEERTRIKPVDLPPPPLPPTEEPPGARPETATPIARIELAPAPVELNQRPEPEKRPEPEESPPGQKSLEDEPMVVDDSFLESGQILPVVAATELGIPVAEDRGAPDGLRPGEERVKIEELAGAEDGTISVVDGGTEVVVVEEQTSFSPEPAAAGPGVPVLTPLETGEGSRDTAPLDRPPTPAPSHPAETPPPPDRLENLARDLAAGEPEKTSLARVSLLSAGAEAVPAIMQQFPGRLLYDAAGASGSMPPVSEHSELLRCLVDLGEEAAPAVAMRLEDPDPSVRRYAVLFLKEVYYPQAVPRLAKRLYDRDARIRLAAIEALQTYRKTTSFDQMLADLRTKLKTEDRSQQAIAAALLGNFKDGDALPLLAPLVKAPEKMVSRAAVESLSFITKQDFGPSERKWLKWWKTHKGERRIQWLIDGLRSKNRDIRFSSARELSQITNEHFGYYFDSKKEDREQAVQRWEQWWEEKGRRMHFDD